MTMKEVVGMVLGVAAICLLITLMPEDTDIRVKNFISDVKKAVYIASQPFRAMWGQAEMERYYARLKAQQPKEVSASSRRR